MEAVESVGLNNGEFSADANPLEMVEASLNDPNYIADEEMECPSEDDNGNADQENSCDQSSEKEMSDCNQPDNEYSCGSVSRGNSQSDTESGDKKRKATLKAKVSSSNAALVKKIYRYRCRWIGKGWCATCNYQLNSRDHAKSHMSMKHARDTMYQCEFCQYRVRLKSRLTRHFASVHSKDVSDSVTSCSKDISVSKMSEDESNHSDSYPPKKLIKCRFCFYEVYSNYMRSHLFSVHHMKRPCQQCRYCNVRTGKVSKLSEHLFRHSNLQVFTCSQCDYKTTRWQYLSRHMSFEHTDLIDKGDLKLSDEKQRCQVETGLDADHFRDYSYKIFVCDQCFFTSGKHTKLNKHIIRSHLKYFKDDSKSGLELFEDSKPILKEIKMESLTPKKFFCLKCDFVTIHESLYQEHLACNHMKIQNIQMFTCEYCPFTTCYPHSVKRHYNNVHIKMRRRVEVPIIKQFQCDFCLKIYNKKIQLRKHITQDHDEDRPYNCNLCDFKAATRKEMPAHMKLHF